MHISPSLSLLLPFNPPSLSQQMMSLCIQCLLPFSFPPSANPTSIRDLGQVVKFDFNVFFSDAYLAELMGGGRAAKPVTIRKSPTTVSVYVSFVKFLTVFEL